MKKEKNMDTATAPTPASAAAVAEGNGTKRKKLPEVQKVFKTEAELNEGQKVAIEKGHTYDTRKFSVASADGKVIKYVLAYSPANAASQVFEDLGIKVDELDAKARTPFQPSKEKAVDTIIGNASSLTDEQKEALLKAMGIDPKKVAHKK